jgi:AraC family transcriptional regulator
MDSYLAAVQRALDHIEDHLREPLPLESIARRAGFSLWHFQRIFTAYVGEPLGSYVRRRRLTAAAAELRASPRRLLDLALDYQFESHEAFTRAFKSVFLVTPATFRRNRQLPWVHTRPHLSSAHLRHLSRNIAVKPQIIQLPAFTLLGLETRFISAMSPEANNLVQIPPLFDRFFKRRAELPPALDGFTYGACNCLPADQRTREDELVFLVSAHVAADAKIPAGMKTWRLPARTYAHFTHRGPINRLRETISYIYGAWLPRSDFHCADGPQLERYDGRFGDGGEQSELDYLIPVTPKSS